MTCLEYFTAIILSEILYIAPIESHALCFPSRINDIIVVVVVVVTTPGYGCHDSVPGATVNWQDHQCIIAY